MPRECYCMSIRNPFTDSFEAHIESSDEESTGEAIPFHSKGNRTSQPNKNDDEDDEEDEGEEEEDV